MLGRRTLLIVEDQPDLLAFFRDALAMAGYDVCAFADGWRALQWLEGYLPDVIVLDLMMPGINGLDVLQELEKDPVTRKIPVVVVTGTPLEPSESNTRCVLRKPVTAPELVRAIEECIGSSAFAKRTAEPL